ncbi:MAG: hypothetical protein AAF558_06985 [Verrucomicrobiota bacterium]
MGTDHAVYDKALYGEAVCLWHEISASKERVEKAQAFINQILHSKPSGTLAPYVLKNLSRIEELRDYDGDQANLEKAQAYYRDVLDGKFNGTIVDEVAFYYAGTWVQKLERPDSVEVGVSFLLEYLDKNPNNPYATALSLESVPKITLLLWNYVIEPSPRRTTKLIIYDDFYN